MARKKSEFSKSPEAIAAVFQKVVATVISHGGTDEDLEKIGTDDASANSIAAVILGRAKVTYLTDAKPISEYAEKFIALLLEVNSDIFSQRGRDSRDIMIGELWRSLRTLTYREREILKLRYGVGDGYTYTREEVGRIFKVTHARIRQIEAKAIIKLQSEELLGPIRKEFKRSGVDDTTKENGGEVATESPEDVLAKLVTELNFSVRTRNFLKRMKIQTLGGVAFLLERDILADRFCGETTCFEIRETLRLYNLDLRKEDESSAGEA